MIRLCQFAVHVKSCATKMRWNICASRIKRMALSNRRLFVIVCRSARQFHIPPKCSKLNMISPKWLAIHMQIGELVLIGNWIEEHSNIRSIWRSQGCSAVSRFNLFPRRFFRLRHTVRIVWNNWFYCLLRRINWTVPWRLNIEYYRTILFLFNDRLSKMSRSNEIVTLAQ